MKDPDWVADDGNSSTTENRASLSDDGSSSPMNNSDSASDDTEPRSPRIVKLRLGRGVVSAVAHNIDPRRHHVLRLTLIRGFWFKLIWCLLLRLPLAARNYIREIFPTYFLPDTVIVKKLEPRHDEYFNNEQCMYKKLEPLQGRVIPVYYGEALCEGARALVLSEVRGVLSCEQELPYLEWAEFRALLQAATAELARFGVSYSDNHLDNLFLVDGRVVFIDLEMAEEADPEWLASFGDASVSQFMREYSRYLNDPDNP